MKIYQQLIKPLPVAYFIDPEPEEWPDNPAEIALF